MTKCSITSQAKEAVTKHPTSPAPYHRTRSQWHHTEADGYHYTWNCFCNKYGRAWSTSAIMNI